MTLSNGIGWSPDWTLMYFIDSTTQQLDVFDFDLTAGTLANRRQLAKIDDHDGMPDGLAVDAEGGIWVCLFRGGAIRRYEPDGALSAVIPLPVTDPTCPAFGGPELRTLYVTTARHMLSRDEQEREPLAGMVLSFEPGVAGMPAQPFAG
jgi:sugar lactone lactonase YvrE